VSGPRFPDPDRWARIEEVFLEAVELPPAAVPAVLDRLCGNDVELRREVEALLRASGPAAGFLDALAKRAGLDFDGEAAAPAAAGRRLGSYRLLREIGRGGMGAVYLAERADDQFEKQVAVKLLPLGLDGAAARERFLVERQILAQLEHPGIARLLDGGVADDGTPFFVMEHVEGAPITRYCAERNCSLEERLKLFLQLCDAVDYAHRNLVVHRDIKPGNVLVTAGGQAKLLDFGIAKVMAAQVDAQSAATAAGLPLTPAYASPEQLRGEPVTTAADVYALGMLLYELLAGCVPYDVAAVTPGERARMISTAPLRPPSAAVLAMGAAAAPAKGAAAAPNLARRLRGDLDRIVLMALRQEPSRRYGSAAALAEDVRRFLRGLPVAAQPDRWSYRFGKFARRRPALLASAAVALLAVIGFSTSLFFYAHSLERERDAAQVERDRARLQTDKAERVTEFVVGLFEASDPAVARGENVRASDLLSRGIARLHTLSAQPEVQAAMLSVLSRVQLSLGTYAEAGRLAEESLRLRQTLFAGAHPDVAASLYEVGVVMRRRQRYAEAQDHFRRAAEMQLELYGPEHPALARSTVELTSLQFNEDGDAAHAEQVLRRVLTVQRAALGSHHVDIPPTLQLLSDVLHRSGQIEAAGELTAQVLQLRRALLGDTHPDLVMAHVRAGLMVNNDASAATAEEHFRRAVLLQRTLGEHPRLITALLNLGQFHGRTGDPAAAEPLVREALELARRFHIEEPYTIAHAQIVLGGLLFELGQFAEAELLIREAIPVIAVQSPVRAMSNGRLLGRIMLAQGDLAGAVTATADAVDGYRAGPGDENPMFALTLAQLGQLYQQQGHLEAARLQLAAAVAQWRQLLAQHDSAHGPQPARVPSAGAAAASVAATASGAAAASGAATAPDAAVVARQRQNLATWAARSFDALAALLREMGRAEEAEMYARESLRLQR
jgi:eukaryotic-like serine/threonine-protein kinase